MATEKLDTTAENDNDGSADATVARPTTRAAEDEVFVKQKRPADFNNDGPLENDHDNTQEEEPEQTTAAEEADLPANDSDAEVDVGREEILTDEEVKHRTNPEGDKVLEKVEEEIVSEDTREGEQCPREEVHAQNGTQDASKQNAPRQEGESGAFFNRPGHHSIDTKTDALRMSNVENGKARERTRLTPRSDLCIRSNCKLELEASSPNYITGSFIIGHNLKLRNSFYSLKMIEYHENINMSITTK
ncbi:hypothetical protein FQA39_LY04204 [Lamprigera yunnana]|nr:hypothetical protein FQA39_LY04204 [Lamprigera yunnana]